MKPETTNVKNVKHQPSYTKENVFLNVQLKTFTEMYQKENVNHVTLPVTIVPEKMMTNVRDVKYHIT